MSADANNPWKGSVVSASVDDEFRMKLKRATKSMKFQKCMVTGEKKDVIAAHILPRRTDLDIVKKLSLTKDDINSPRNGIFLCKGIEEAFDNLRISFYRTNPLSLSLHLKIWDDSVRGESIYKGSMKNIGDYEGHPLNLRDHKPFMRCLSYHSYIAYKKSNLLEKEFPQCFGTPPQAGVMSDKLTPIIGVEYSLYQELRSQHINAVKEEDNDAA